MLLLLLLLLVLSLPGNVIKPLIQVELHCCDTQPTHKHTANQQTLPIEEPVLDNIQAACTESVCAKCVCVCVCVLGAYIEAHQMPAR